MATEVKIPTPDQTTEEVRIVKWSKAPGDTVRKGDILLEIETDKAVLEVEAAASGVLIRQLFAEGEMVPVGRVVGFIGERGEAVQAPSEKTAAAAQPTAAVTAQPLAQEGVSVKASPLAKKVSQKLGVDLAEVPGTGHGGKVMRRDVEGFTASNAATVTSSGRVTASPNAKRLARELGVDLRSVTGTGPQGRITGKDIQKFAAVTKPAAAASPQPGTVVPLTKMRKAIAINLQGSFRERPHFNVTMSVDMTRAWQVRSTFNASRPEDKRLSVNHLVIIACARSLRQHPAVNSRFEEDRINYLPDVNIGIATAIEAGLVVPVLTSADKLTWDELVVQSKKLVEDARKGRVSGAGKGTFTITNLGMFGVDSFTAIINPPESAILAVGAVKNEVVDTGGGIGVRPMMKITLCSDHRVIDGVAAAQFLQGMKIYLEQEIVCP
jgi:pyruvate dehydrogenase E2 component (dihydrolipoamide acetyltransferase)